MKKEVDKELNSCEVCTSAAPVFENLSGNHLEKTNLSVIELKFDGK